MEFCEIISKYGLHDSYINKIECYSKTITLVFNDGIYYLDENGCEDSKTPKCKMQISFRALTCDDILSCVEVYKCRKGRFKEISISKLFKMLEINRWDLDIDYYSKFSNSMLLKGYVGKYLICLLICDIEKINLEM